jgi:hypothetical protein
MFPCLQFAGVDSTGVTYSDLDKVLLKITIIKESRQSPDSVDIFGSYPAQTLSTELRNPGFILHEYSHSSRRSSPLSPSPGPTEAPAEVSQTTVLTILLLSATTVACWH